MLILRPRRSTSNVLPVATEGGQALCLRCLKRTGRNMVKLHRPPYLLRRICGRPMRRPRSSADHAVACHRAEELDLRGIAAVA